MLDAMISSLYLAKQLSVSFLRSCHCERQSKFLHFKIQFLRHLSIKKLNPARFEAVQVMLLEAGGKIGRQRLVLNQYFRLIRSQERLIQSSASALQRC